MKPKAQTSKRSGERGFALLVVFLISAGIAISLYMELPRVSFESERNREEMLIERGEEYARAVELFYRKNRRYPAKIEDLESFNERRYLRKRYKDPLTGKDEWRLIHMGAGGLSDSLVEKQQQGLKTGLPGQTPSGSGPNSQQTNGQQANGQQQQPAQQLGPDGQPLPPEVNSVIARSRPSDRMPVRGAAGPGAPGYDPNNPNAQFQPQDPSNPNPNNPNPNLDPNQQQLPNQPQLVQQQQPVNGNQITPPPGFIYNTPGQPGYNASLPQGLIPINAYQNQTGFGNPTGGVQPGGLPNPNNQFGQPGNPFGQPGQQPQLGGPNAAINAINNSLRNPTPNQSFASNFGSANPGGTNGIGPSPSGFDQPSTTNNPNANPFASGLAGVASLQKGVGIKKYNERSKFVEWEFVYDYRKPKKKGPASNSSLGLQQSDMSNSNVGNTGANSSNNNGSGFGSGSSSGFGGNPNIPGGGMPSGGPTAPPRQ